MTGVDDPYEAPAAAELVLDTEQLDLVGVGRAGRGSGEAACSTEIGA